MNPTKMALIAAALLLPAAQALADGGEHSKKEIKLLKDSAAALSSTNPDLSKRLKTYASKEAGEKEETKGQEAETSDKDDINMLKEASSALKTSRPDLSKGLQKFAAKEEREEAKESDEQPMRSGGHEAPQQPVQPGY